MSLRDCPYCDDTGIQQVGPEPGMVDACFCEAGSRQVEARYAAPSDDEQPASAAPIAPHRERSE
jgi:hypothetical protein